MLPRRLRNDFPLTIISLLGAMALLALGPYVVYRFATGAMLHGSLNLLVVLTVLGTVSYAWRTGDCRSTGIFLAVVSVASASAISSLIGSVGQYWFFVALLASYLLMRASEASILILVALVAMMLHGGAFDSAEQMTVFVASTLLVSLFAYVFRWRADEQHNQLEMLATLDPLTGCSNRRAMDHELQIAIKVHERAKTPCAVAMLDLDHFKAVNDKFGHEAGDQVLVNLVELLRNHTRHEDRLFRFGGEEFVLLLPGVSETNLLRVCDKLRLVIAGALNYKGYPVTLSMGVAMLHPGENWQSWLLRADKALYEAKQSGRNKVCVAPPSTDDDETKSDEAKSIA